MIEKNRQNKRIIFMKMTHSSKTLFWNSFRANKWIPTIDQMIIRMNTVDPLSNTQTKSTSSNSNKNIQQTNPPKHKQKPSPETVPSRTLITRAWPTWCLMNKISQRKNKCLPPVTCRSTKWRNLFRSKS